MSNALCSLFILRHGETEWNVKKIIQGQSESYLTKKGKEQVKIVARVLKKIHFTAVFSSDLERARESAQIISIEKKLAIKTTKLLRERTFGNYEGIKAEKYNNEIRHLLKEFENLNEKEKWKFKFAKGYESDEEVVSRFITFLREIAAAYLGRNVLVVTHGGPIRLFLTKLGYAEYGQLPPNSIPNAGYIKVLSDGVDFFIKQVWGIKLMKKDAKES